MPVYKSLYVVNLLFRSCTLKNHRQSTKDHVQQGKQWYAKHYTDQATRTPLKTGVNFDALPAPIPTPVVYSF
jgi:hypothetical protein